MLEKEFNFEMDDLMVDLILKYEDQPMISAYHYALACGERNLVLRRLHLKDCFTAPYSPLFLKIVDGPISVVPVSSIQDMKNFMFSAEDFMRCGNEFGVSNHKSINLTQALILSDSSKLNLKAAVSIAFVQTALEPKKVFRKVAEKTESSFTVVGERESFYEYQPSVVSKYHKRINGKELLLCEFSVFYDFLGIEKSKTLYEVYKVRDFNNS